MTIETDSDRLAMLDDWDTGHHTSADGRHTAKISGIFSRSYVPTDVGGIEIENRGPAFLARESDTALMAAGDTLEVNGATYAIVGVEPDGTGMATIVLAAT